MIPRYGCLNHYMQVDIGLNHTMTSNKKLTGLVVRDPDYLADYQARQVAETDPYVFLSVEDYLEGDIDSKTVWRGFVKKTTAHGVKNYISAKGAFKRIYWFLALLFALGTVLYNFTTVTWLFFKYETSFDVEVRHEPSLVFPAVTICNMNPVKRSSVRELFAASTRTRRRKRAVGVCDTGWDEYNGHCYYFSVGTKSWNDAQAWCTTKGAHLVHIDDSAEGAQIEAFRNTGNDAWLGMRLDTGNWKLTDGTISSYTNWNNGEPNGSGDCVRIVSASTWRDMDCTDLYDYICEKAIETTAAPTTTIPTTVETTTIPTTVETTTLPTTVETTTLPTTVETTTLPTSVETTTLPTTADATTLPTTVETTTLPTTVETTTLPTTAETTTLPTTVETTTLPTTVETTTLPTTADATTLPTTVETTTLPTTVETTALHTTVETTTLPTTVETSTISTIVETTALPTTVEITAVPTTVATTPPPTTVETTTLPTTLETTTLPTAVETITLPTTVETTSLPTTVETTTLPTTTETTTVPSDIITATGRHISTLVSTIERQNTTMAQDFYTTEHIGQTCCCTCCSEQTYLLYGKSPPCAKCSAASVSLASECASFNISQTLVTISPAHTGGNNANISTELPNDEVRVSEEFDYMDKVITAMSNVDQAAKASFGHSLESMILDCRYSGYNCNSTWFSEMFNPIHGNCYIFNSGWNNATKIHMANVPGRRHGLHLVVNINQDEYIESGIDIAGIRVVVHSQDRISFPEDEGVTVSPGRSTSVNIKQVKMNYLPEPYGNCIDNKQDLRWLDAYHETYPVNYSSQGCSNTCYQRNVVETCGCADPYYIMTGSAITNSTVRACDVSQESCKNVIKAKFIRQELGCHCPASCASELFPLELSVGKWPSNVRKTILQESLSPRIRDTLDVHDDRAFSQNLIKLEIFFTDFNYEFITENKKYTGSGYMSGMGGVFSLWVGFSVFTIVELVEVIIDMVMCWLMGDNKSDD